MQNIIETSSLIKRYDGRPVVNGLSLSVPEGCIYGFIGANGAGKSTTMKMLLGLVKPTGGTIRILGQTMSAQNRLGLLRQTGSLIESPACYGHLTAQENLEIAASLKGVPASDIDRVLGIVGLSDSSSRLVRQYSLGMRQRLGIAQALLGNPRLLILDEPTNGLDPAGMREMRSLIRSMPDRCGATVLISSHLLSEMEQMAEHVGVIHHGQLVFQGLLTDLQRHSRGDILLRVLRSELAAPILNMHPCSPDSAEFTLPPMEDSALARLIMHLAQSGAGVVEVKRREKTLEEIFLSLTRRDEA